jgi:hypothetical protein
MYFKSFTEGQIYMLLPSNKIFYLNFRKFKIAWNPHRTRFLKDVANNVFAVNDLVTGLYALLSHVSRHSSRYTGRQKFPGNQMLQNTDSRQFFMYTTIAPFPLPCGMQ